MNISADLVKSLRESTGVGMMECKKALVEANGDLEKAILLLRESGTLKALKKSTRIAKEGIIAYVEREDSKKVACVEVNCETDFVARQENFIAFAQEVAQLVFLNNPKDLPEILRFKIGMHTVEEKRTELITQLGENIAIGNFYCHEINQGVIGCYAHKSGNGIVNIIACVTLDTDHRDVARSIAMQVAAMDPLSIDEGGIPQDILQKEEAIWRAEINKEFADKPAAVQERIFTSKKQKFIAERSLLGQEFIKDSTKTVAQYLKGSGSKVLEMKRMTV